MRILIRFLVVCFVLAPVSAVAQNHAPIADAGPDQYIFTGELTLLQGSAIDPDNNAILAWLWTVESAPPGSSPYLSNPTRPDPGFAGNVVGEYILSLIASDGVLWSEPDSVTISMEDLLPPVAVATADTTSGPAPLTIHFDGSGSYSPNELPLSYRWNFDDASELSSEVAPIHTYDLPGTYNAELYVKDNRDQIDFDILQITVDSPVTGVEDQAGAEQFLLHANVPNPFATATTIRYEIAKVCPVQLSIFDLRGRRVRTLVHTTGAPGQYELRWDGRDDAGRQVGAGVYLYRLRAGSQVSARKLVILR